ncbi:MAG: DUF192 domain-containing protein [Chloroflexi bacterium]|nr:DUF192 domain-containing protein [Chloroflexota bacterium]
MQAFNHTRQRYLAEHGPVAGRPWARMRGLIGRASLQPNEGLLLLGTKGIHTIGMRFPIDVLFLNADGWVIHSIHGLKPFRLSPYVKNATMVIELAAGVLRETGTQVGDWIKVTRLSRVTTQRLSNTGSVRETA